ncbi:MAG: hypothetical protein ACK4YP_22585 [Myxococcota bacterium]
MLLLVLPAALAQSADECGTACAVIEPVLYGVPFFTGILGAAASLLWHRSLVSAAARAWRGGTVSSSKLWVMPILGGYSVPMLGASIVLGLALWKRDFLTLLMLDASELPVILVWAVFALLLPGAPLFVALARRT